MCQKYSKIPNKLALMPGDPPRPPVTTGQDNCRLTAFLYGRPSTPLDPVAPLEVLAGQGGNTSPWSVRAGQAIGSGAKDIRRPALFPRRGIGLGNLAAMSGPGYTGNVMPGLVIHASSDLDLLALELCEVLVFVT